MRRRRTIAAALVLTLAMIAVARHPTADIQILTSDSADPSPRRLEAAVDLGIVGVKLLVTWTADHLNR